MGWLADYHMHTPLCGHASGEPTEYAAQALKVGLKEIGFSDHSPMREDGFDNWRMRRGQLDEYVAKVRRAQSDHPGLSVKLALEVDYMPGQEDWIRELSGLHPWDYLIGSVHYVSETWAVDDPQQVAHWRTRDPFEVWSCYFERLTAAAESGLFNIIGHADLPKKFGIIPREDCTPLFRTFLKAAKATSTAVEFNTAGLRKDCHEIYPSPAFARLMKEYEVGITFGSDAHAVEEVGKDLGDALKLARDCGFTHAVRFERRNATTVRLPET